MNETAAKMLFEAQLAMIPEQLLSLRNWHVYDMPYPILEIRFRGDTHAELLVELRW